MNTKNGLTNFVKYQAKTKHTISQMKIMLIFSTAWVQMVFRGFAKKTGNCHTHDKHYIGSNPSSFKKFTRRSKAVESCICYNYYYCVLSATIQ